MSGARSIDLVEEMPEWGVSRDQEGVVWLTCMGLPILDLEGAFRKVVGVDPTTEQQAIGDFIERFSRRSHLSSVAVGEAIDPEREAFEVRVEALEECMNFFRNYPGLRFP